jgi:hypothetical protein
VDQGTGRALSAVLPWTRQQAKSGSPPENSRRSRAAAGPGPCSSP